jgi:MoaA/NifB/PqqE/SkfB family radical SAM enzyme
VSFSDILRKTWSENILFSVLVELTYRCNLDCVFCYNDLGLRGEPLTKDEYFRFFADLADLEVLNLTLSGGEPLAHPDFLALGARARELGFVVRIKSNGHALRGEMARRIRDEVDPFLIEVSLHGATAATHDRQTRVPGSFEHLLANLREMLDLGLRVKINSTLTLWNESEAEGMLDLAATLGLPIQVDPEVSPRDDGDRGPMALSPTREGVRQLFALQAERAGAAPGALASSGEKHCGAGSAGVAVDPYGNVYPCVQWRRPVGSLHRQSIREIWQDSSGLREVRRLTAEAKKVVDGYGPSGGFLNFCPGSAATRSGDPLEVYPEALLRMDVTDEVLARKKSPLRILR